MTPEILQFLGLDDKATAEQVIAAMRALKSAPVTEVAHVQPSLKDFVPRSDYDAALARVSSIEKAQVDAAALAHSARVETVVASAMKSGKITPATKAFYVATCSTDDGLKLFEDFVQSAPVIAPSDVVSGEVPTTRTEITSSEDLAIAAKCGIAPDAFLAARKI